MLWSVANQNDGHRTIVQTVRMAKLIDKVERKRTGDVRQQYVQEMQYAWQEVPLEISRERKSEGEGTASIDPFKRIH